MKLVPLYDLPGGIKSLGIIRQVLEIAPPPGPGRPGGIDVGSMRARCRVLDALDAVAPDATELRLEDADHAMLVRAINDFPFGVANANLLKVLDGVLEAKAPAEAEKKPPKPKAA